MSPKASEHLLAQLLLKHPDATPEEYQEFFMSTIEHRFARILHLYNKNEEFPQGQDTKTSLPAEREISCLLNLGHPELFLKNIVYHLGRNKKVLPPALLPHILSLIKDYPDLWADIYDQHSELTLALAYDNDQWNYIIRAFSPDISLKIGSPGYYESLSSQMKMMPLRTSTYIQEIWHDVSHNQQARLLEILHEDNTAKTLQFITTQINHSRKPVRLAALKSCILRKEELIYDPIKQSLVQQLRNPEKNSDTELDESLWYQLSASWKDLKSLTEEISRENILISLTDPDDYLFELKTVSLTQYREPILYAAIFHRSQKTLYNMAKASPSLLHDVNFAAALDSATATKLLNVLCTDSSTTFDQNFIALLTRADLFLDEPDSKLVWKKFVQQWAEMPFTLEELPLEILALRIHPNIIKHIWQHPFLQETTPALQKIRKILKYRLAFLKKCYKS